METKKRTAWNKGLKGKQSWHNISGLGKNIDFKKRGKNISKAMTGMKRSQEYKEKRAELMKKKWIDPEYRASQVKAQKRREDSKSCMDCNIELVNYNSSRCRSCWGKSVEGKGNPQWKGGITPINKSLRNSKEYILWRTAVFIRDDYTCQECNIRGGTLNADHIKPFALYPELRLAIDNGRTLCIFCHRQTDTWGGRAISLRKESD